MHHRDIFKSELHSHQEIMLFYKIHPCTQVSHTNFSEAPFNSQNCDQFFCFGYHNPSERRRQVLEEETSALLYQPAICSSISESGVCAKGDSCRLSHTHNESLFHPLLYKTEACAGCAYQGNSKFCPYYHTDEASRKVALDKFKAKSNKDTSKSQQDLAENDQNTFDLDNFKAHLCPFKTNHNPKVCEYYHHDKDRKRPVSIFNYSPNLCSYAEKGKNCPRGDNCNHCHNKVEQLYHPERYKRKFCLAHPHSIHKCEYGDFCSFAHNEDEIQIELLHNIKKDEDFYLYKYKTVFCPYIYDHDRNQCVYAHNPQDYRRDPSLYSYNPTQCQFWSKGQIYSYEEGACPQQMDCDHCHGWKELEFHPMYYKTKPCNNGKKCNKKDCPFYHSNSEKRDPQSNSQSTSNSSALKISNNGNSFKKISDSNENDPKLSSESSRQKLHKKKESHYARPIIPVYVPTNKEASQPSSDVKSKRIAEPSTRPNSNISSIYFSGEDAIRIVPPKKKKGKRMSLQNQKEKLVSPISAKSDKPKGQLTTEPLPPQVNNIWERSNQENHEKFDIYFNTYESNKLLNGSRGNDSFESWQSYTVEKNICASDKPSEIANDQFIYTLFSNLERKGLDHTIQHLKNPNPDVELLKSFSSKDFSLFPQISFEDKDRIVKIIQDILEEEAILSEINTVNEGGFTTSLTQNNTDDNGVFANLGPYNSSHDFSITSLLQKYS